MVPGQALPKTTPSLRRSSDRKSTRLRLYRGWLGTGQPRRHNRNWLLLWAALTALLVLTAGLLFWLVDLYANGKEQLHTEIAVGDLSEWTTRSLIINLQDVQGVASAGPGWPESALHTLRSTKYLHRLERRDISLKLAEAIDNPALPPLFGVMPRYRSQKEALQACAAAAEPGIPAYSPSYFVPVGNGVGLEVIDLCVAEQTVGTAQLTGFTVATIGLHKLLETAIAVSEPLAKTHEVSFLLSDDTRLARAGLTRTALGVPHGPPRFRAEKVLAVPGLQLRMRLENLRGRAPLQLNLVTGAGATLSLLLIAVICLLLREVKRRSDGAAVIRHQQERLQAAARLATVGEIATLISHEINQPLHSISMCADAAAHIAAGHQNVPPDLLKLLRNIADQAMRAGRVVKGVRDFVSRGQVVRETVPAGELIQAVLPIIELQAKDTAAELLVDLGRRSLRVECDRLMVEQLILNLARNGLQAMRTNAVDRVRELHITARRAEGDSVQIEVRDTGPGLDPETISRLAQPLYKPFESSKGDGMGLGLSLCRSVAEAHLGVLSFANVRGSVPGSIDGAVFTFTMPGNPVSSSPTLDEDTVPHTH